MTEQQEESAPNSTAQHGIQNFRTSGPSQLTEYLENFNIRHEINLLAKEIGSTVP